MKKAELFIHAAIIAILFAFVSIPLVGTWAVKSHFEAKAYNRATGADVTTWDAMWIELRVQAEPRQ